MLLKHISLLATIAAKIHPYQTQAEALRKLGDQFQRTCLTPWEKSLIKGLLKLG